MSSSTRIRGGRTLAGLEDGGRSCQMRFLLQDPEHWVSLSVSNHLWVVWMRLTQKNIMNDSVDGIQATVLGE